MSRAPGADEVAYYAQHLGLAGPSLVAMCGAGELLLPLIAAGHNVHGVDPSTLAIAACEAQLAQRGLTAPLFRQALPELNLPFRYGAAFIAAGALQRIVDPLLAFNALSRVRAHLVAPMTLVVECVLPPEALHAPGAPVVEVRTAATADGAQIVWRSETRVDVEGRRIDRSNRFEKRAGRAIVAREDDRSALTWYLREELDALLLSVGFAHVDFEAPCWQADAAAEQRIVAIARG
ncbi:MAG: hypothetical protein ABI440_13335 [Casimicrobiaceae bacterium]